MSFSSTIFIVIFLPIFLICWRLLPDKWHSVEMLAGSLLFYAYGQPVMVLALMASIGANFGLYQIMRKGGKPGLAAMIIGVELNLIPLIYCKITGAMPLGISFYTFQAISLQVDLYRAGSEAEPVDFFTYASFLSMFPKLTMGPIARFKDMQAPAEANISAGLRLFVVGLSMKVLLADSLGSVWSNVCATGVLGLSTATAWLGALAYTLELYMDFWGYSLMAMAIGIMLGIPIPANFNDPYCSKTVAEFWRRWHITLGSWFRDYVYIPLGGSRKGAFRTFINLLVVWALTGIWHGNGLNFLAWGLVLFIFIALEKYTPLGRLQDTKVLGHLYILLVIPLTWVIFARSDLTMAVQYLECMFGIYQDQAVPTMTQFWRYLRDNWYFFGAALVLITPYPARFYRKWGQKWPVSLALVGLFWLSMYMLYKSGSSGFLYYQF